MALSAVESMNPLVSNCLIGGNYQVRLNQSLQNLLAEIRKETPNLSHFVDVFYELMQAKIDPPLESIWVYSALLFRSSNSTNEDPLNRLSVIRDLFQLVSACSSSCSSSKSIALLAPVIFEVYKLVVELLGKDSGSKREKKVIREAKSLIDVILGYVSICCCKDLGEESGTIEMKLLMPVQDLVSVWMDGNESLQIFLPFLSDEICIEITQRGFDVNYLAGMVIVEAFVLKLCIGLRFPAAGMEMERELRSWAVGAITGFGSFYFSEILVKMLLQPVLPITSLLNSEDGVLLRNILYDAVILVEYSFLNSQRAVHLPAEHVKSLTMARLIVTQKAIKCFRENGDQKKAICYSNAFSNSRLPSQLTKWITTQIGMHKKADILRGSSPIALIKWLLELDRKGIKVFDDCNLKYHAKSVLDDSKADSEQPGSKPDLKVDDDLLFYIDNKRDKVDGEGKDEDEDEDKDEDEDEDEMKNESISASFVAAAHSMKSTENGGRKRKVGEGTERKEKKKNLKSVLGSAGDKFSSDDSDSEVENPPSDSD